ncbi:fasciculation and elongation protein zeta-2 isoform X2 [Musca domestica]|uniref:Fasciculation and elongation protein zeta-2 isoform X2 n=1 Tax=Musca domestica TaxID=7370 RepID=A0A1I8MLI3_MUSDO|nr:fasciculation and elongation protein zeta-2 isoform X2 [Musca domestica]
MRELGSKMAELKFEAPLAKMDETDDWAGCDFISNQNTINDSLNLNLKDPMIAQENKIRLLEEAVRDAHVSKNGGYPTAAVGNGTISPNCNTMLSNEMTTALDAAMDSKSLVDATDNFSEAFGGSLEDLVNTFDEKITKCFGNFEENVEALAPVQVRSQDEIMNECQMWWTITGNFGQNTNNKQGGSSDVQTPADDLNSEDEAIANDLDMHALILHGLNNEPEEPIKSVEEVIKEIEYIIDEAESPTDEATTCESEVMEKAKEVLGAPLYAEKLQYLSINQLNELYMEMEVLIQELSETLINELALRDELEFEKELKNSFISILLAVQNKRRQYHVEKKRGKFQGPEPKYLTTVIPYTMENGTPNNQNLQVLIKILKAINEDSPTVPTLLTDYILKVLCPT